MLEESLQNDSLFGRLKKVHSQGTYSLALPFDLFRPVLQNANVKCGHYHLLPQTPFFTYDTNANVWTSLNKTAHIWCLDIFEQCMTKTDANIPWYRCNTCPSAPTNLAGISLQGWQHINHKQEFFVKWHQMNGATLVGFPILHNRQTASCSEKSEIFWDKILCTWWLASMKYSLMKSCVAAQMKLVDLGFSPQNFERWWWPKILCGNLRMVFGGDTQKPTCCNVILFGLSALTGGGNPKISLGSRNSVEGKKYEICTNAHLGHLFLYLFCRKLSPICLRPCTC